MRVAHLLLIIYFPLSLSRCMECCLPGGDCSSAYKGSEGICCGGVRGVSVCCPRGSFCVRCNGEVKCSYTPRSYCSPSVGGWGVLVPLMAAFLSLACLCNSCREEHRRGEGIVQVVSGVPVTGHHPNVPAVRSELVPPHPSAQPSSVVLPFGAGLLAGIVVSDVLEEDQGCTSGGFETDT